MAAAADSPNPELEFRWQGWLQRSGEGVFVLNRRRRLVFANRAWERATGLFLKEVRGRACRRRPRTVLADKEESILGALAPPPEIWKGSPCQVRRLLPGIGRENTWVSLAFLPLEGEGSLLGVLGVVKGWAEPSQLAPQPLPEKWLSLRDRPRFGLDTWEGEDPVLSRVADQIRLAAGQPGLGVLFVGASGTGKLTLARTLHQLSSWRQRFFACLDCDRLSPRAVAEVLFPGGRHGPPLGVILLKQPAALPRELQAQIAQHLENREEATPWILGALREEPDEEVRSGRLIESLYCRLSTLIIRLPALKERCAETLGLTGRLLQRISSVLDSPPQGIRPEAVEHLRAHDWPGNLHELSRVLLEAALRCPGKQIETDQLPLYLRARDVPPERSFNLDRILETVERRLIELALRLAEGNKKKASDLLGIWRARFIRRMEALGIEKAADQEE